MYFVPYLLDFAAAKEGYHGLLGIDLGSSFRIGWVHYVGRQFKTLAPAGVGVFCLGNR